jgi:hypothetical protein
MDLNQYNNLFVYLTLNQLPTFFNPNEIVKLKRQSKFYMVQFDFLYKKQRQLNAPEKFLRVIKETELDAILYMMHNDPTAGHFSTDIMFNKVRTRYYWP